jgi:hypothetical protein
MATSNLRVISYVRDLSIKTNKFSQFDEMIRNAWKEQADAVAIASPQVLGDTYDELIRNLNLLAEKNLLLAIVPPKADASHN